MSKGDGLKIGIKFTEDLVGDVSGKVPAPPYSFYRWYITSTWSSSGRLYLYELEFFSNGIKVNTNKIISMAGSSRFSSSYDVDRLFDGSVPGTEWDANGSLPHWVSIELDEAVIIDSFRWHTGTSGNKPKEFILQGSNDGISWVDIYMGESPNLNNWIDFVVSVGNEIAFTVTGKEYQYVNGPLVDKEYQVDKVERYPIQRVWELGGELKLESQMIGYTDDLTPKMTSNNAPSGEVTFSRQNNTDGNAAFRAFDKDNETRWTTGSVSNGWIAYEFPSQQNICKYTIRAHPTNGNSAPRNWTFEGWDGTNYVILDEQNNINFSNGEYKEFTFNNNNYYIKYRLNVSLNGGADFLGIAELELMSGIYEFITPKKYTSQPIAIEGEYRIRWIENKPTNTNINIEYTTGETQGQWQEVSNGDIITSDTNLWIRATLSTEDTTITPVLKDLWLEEASAPQDKILITMHPQGRFNNVVGPLTVQYDQTVGSLRGRGGLVEGFTETFTPTDLEPKPNPHVAENIEVSAEASVDFIEVTYKQGYAADEQITVSASATVDFIYVGVINP
jgi:hypothetical protein